MNPNIKMLYEERMSILEMVQNNVNSVIGLTVEYDYGGTNPIVGKIVSSKINEHKIIIDDELSIMYSYSISFDGSTYYVLDKFTKLIG